jgi:hypothetical protein
MSRRAIRTGGRWLRRTILITLLFVVGAWCLILAAGFSNTFGTGARAEAATGAWPDGATADTFWDDPMMDAPGLSVTAIHCHGLVRYDVQLGSTAPALNPCKAAFMPAGSSGSSTEAASVAFLGLSQMERSSVNWGPWIYTVTPGAAHALARVLLILALVVIGASLIGLAIKIAFRPRSQGPPAPSEASAALA